MDKTQTCYRRIQLHLREDQYEKLRELSRKLPEGGGGEPDDWDVIRGIVDAYFWMCENQSSATSPAPPIRGKAGEARRVLLRGPVKLALKFWPAGTELEPIENLPVHRDSPVEPQSKVRFPDGTVTILPSRLLYEERR